MAKDKPTKKDSKSEKTVVVSFRIAESLHQELAKLAQGKTDEAGLDLTPSGMARRLVVESVKDKKFAPHREKENNQK